MNDCRHIEPELGAFAAGDLGHTDHRRVSEHLDGCASCRVELAREEALRGTLESIPLVKAPRELEARVREAIREEKRTVRPAWKSGRLALAATVAAAALAFAILAPGPRGGTGAGYSDQEIAAGRQDVLYTLALTARILDHTQKDTLVDVFGDKLPQAINDSFKMTKTDNTGGNG